MNTQRPALKAIFLASTVLGLGFGITQAARADVVEIPVDEAPSAAIKTPIKGQSMKRVLKQFGAPERKHAPVGGSSVHQPPITRWDYPAFSVFFENGHVVDTVVPGAPPKVQHTDELQPMNQ